MKPHIIFPQKLMDHERLGIMYLSAMLKRNGYAGRLVEAQLKTMAREIPAPENTIVAYSVQGADARYYLEFNKVLKRMFPRITSIFGGIHASLHAGDVIAEEGVDAVCVGEGEHAFLEFVRRFESRSGDMAVRNIWFKEKGRVIENPLRPQVSTLDELPFPDRELFRDYSIAYRSHVLMGSRGCTQRCSYCAEEARSALYGLARPAIRFRSVDNIISEIAFIKEVLPIRVGFLYFWDSIFFDSKQRLAEFADTYASRHAIPFLCSLLAPMVDKEVVSLLRRAQCRVVNLGIECADDGYRRNMLDRVSTNEEIIAAVRMLKQGGIKVNTFNMLGLPDTTIADDFRTLTLNIRCKPTFAFADFYYPIEKTRLYEEHKEQFDRRETAAFTMVSGRPFIKARDRKTCTMMKNLQQWFSVTVSYPFLLPLVKVLVRSPATPILFYFHKAYFFYNRYFVTKPFSLGDYLSPVKMLRAVRRMFNTLVRY